jgi:excisionase family DNA binding protein
MPRAYHAITGLSSVRPEVGAPYSGTGAPEPLTLAQQIRGIGSALSIAKVAKIVGPGRTTLFNMIKSGRIPCLRFGTRIRFDPVVLADWVEERWLPCRSAGQSKARLIRRKVQPVGVELYPQLAL